MNLNVDYDDIHKRMQVLVGILVTSILFIIATNNLFRIIINKLKFTHLYSHVILLYICCIILFMTIFFINKYMQIIQLLCFMFILILSVYETLLGDFHDVLFLTLVSTYFIKYHIVKKNLIFNLIIIFIIYCFLLFVKIIFFNKFDESFFQIINKIITSVGVFILFNGAYYFEQKIINQILLQDQVLISIGKQSAMLMHNIKNSLYKITALDDSLSQDDDIIEHLRMRTALVDDVIFKVRDATDRITSNNLIPNKVSINEIIRKIKNSFMLDKKNSDINIIIKDNHIIIVNGIYIIIFYMINNIIINSIQANAKKIVIETIEEDKYNVLKIKDWGDGNKICNKCSDKKCINCKKYRAGKTTKKQGTGLGIINVQETMNELNGKMLINTKLKKGTTIYLYFRRTK